MTSEARRADLKRILKWLRRNVREWAVRDALRRFTAWGTWKRGERLTLDEADAREVIDYLTAELRGAPDWLVEEMYAPLAHYASAARPTRGRG